MAIRGPALSRPAGFVSGSGQDEGGGAYPRTAEARFRPAALRLLVALPASASRRDAPILSQTSWILARSNEGRRALAPLSLGCGRETAARGAFSLAASIRSVNSLRPCAGSGGTKNLQIIAILLGR
jgi:hypothetical protein